MQIMVTLRGFMANVHPELYIFIYHGSIYSIIRFYVLKVRFVLFIQHISKLCIYHGHLTKQLLPLVTLKRICLLCVTRQPW